MVLRGLVVADQVLSLSQGAVKVMGRWDFYVGCL